MEFRKSLKSAVFANVSGFARCLIPDFSTEARPVHPEGKFPLFARNGGHNFLRIDALRRNHQETLARTHISAKPVPATHLENAPDRSRRQINMVCCKRNAINIFLKCFPFEIIKKPWAGAWFSTAQHLGNIRHARNLPQTL